LHTRITHNCATVDQPIRDIDFDLEHVIEEIDEIQERIEDIQEDMCELYCDKEIWDALDTLMTHIRAHLDEAHYILRDRSHMGGSAGNKMHNQALEVLRRKVRDSYMAHHKAFATLYGHHDLSL
jgi:hypothetical protein